MNTPQPTAPATPDQVTVYDGKYTITGIETGHLHCLRYGTAWRNLEGDGMVLALAQEIQSLRAKATREPTPPNLNELAEAVERALAVWDALVNATLASKPETTLNYCNAMLELAAAYARSGLGSKPTAKHCAQSRTEEK